MIFASEDNRSKRYSAVKLWFLAADLFVGTVSLAVFYFFLARPVSDLSFGISGNFFLACPVYSFIFLAFMYLLSFPLNITGSFFIERRFGLSDRGIKSWAADEIKSVLLSLALYLICIEVFYAAVRSFPGLWWCIAGALWILFSVVLARFLPVFLIPLFFKYSPVDDEDVRGRIMALSEKAGVPVTDVCQIDFSKKTRKANAALVGLGKTRKVILADTLMTEFSNEEIEVVVAHEFGHLKKRHICQLLLFSGCVTFAGFYIFFSAANTLVAITGSTGLSDLTLLPVIVFLAAVFALVLLPVQNLFSRVLERQADRFALKNTDNPQAFISAMERLASMNLAEKDPPLLKKIFLYNHPPICERIRMAEEFRLK